MAPTCIPVSATVDYNALGIGKTHGIGLSSTCTRALSQGQRKESLDRDALQDPVDSSHVTRPRWELDTLLSVAEL